VLATIDSDLRYGDTIRPHTDRHIDTDKQIDRHTHRHYKTKQTHRQTDI